MLDNIENRNYKVIEVNNKEFKLENGDVYQHNFYLSDDITVGEFQILLDNSKESILNLIKNLNK